MAPTKRCTGCRRAKSLDEFHIDRAKRDGHHTQCKACHAVRHKEARKDPAWRKAAIAISAQYRKDNPAKVKAGIRNATLKAKYGIDSAAFDKMAASQGNKCRICSAKLVFEGRNLPAKAVVDHCHTTGRVRGILCHLCNVGLGCFDDDPALLQLAKEYVS